MDTKLKLVAGLAIVVFAVAACNDDGGDDATSPPAPLPATTEPIDGAASPAADTEASPAADGAASPAADGAASPAAEASPAA